MEDFGTFFNCFGFHNFFSAFTFLWRGAERVDHFNIAKNLELFSINFIHEKDLIKEKLENYFLLLDKSRILNFRQFLFRFRDVKPFNYYFFLYCRLHHAHCTIILKIHFMSLHNCFLFSFEASI